MHEYADGVAAAVASIARNLPRVQTFQMHDILTCTRRTRYICSDLICVTGLAQQSAYLTRDLIFANDHEIGRGILVA